MSETSYTFISYLIYIVDIFSYYHLLNSKLTPRFSKRIQHLIYFIAYCFMLLIEVAPTLFPEFPSKILFVLLFFFILLISYRDAFFPRLLWIFSVCFSIFICEIVGISLTLLITKSKLEAVTIGSYPQMLALIFSRVILVIIVELLVHNSQKLSKDFTKDFFIIILVDVIYAITISCFFYFDNLYLTTNTAIALSVFVIFLISFLALYLLRKITKKSEEIMLTNLKMQQIEMEHKQNEDMAIVVNDLRSLRHDMNNHMSVLQGLLSMQEYDDAKNYLSTITEELAVANSFIFTDNKVLSVMLNNKISKAHQLGITFDTELLTSATPFSDNDLCAVVGNILENAIEASSKHEDPYIHFIMKKTDKQFVIECQNNYVVAPVFEKGNLVTTKSDKSYHGIGTKNIRSIVDSYHGITTFTADDLFCVKIVVPI